MHDAIFASQQGLKREDLLRFAAQIGLDVAKFTVALDSRQFRAAVEADRQLGTSLNVEGTPAFFINGRSLFGARDIAEFKSVIEEELKKSPAVVKLPRVKPATDERQPAPVTVTFFADLQSTLTLEAETLLDKLTAAYPGRLRLVFKHRPVIEIHPDAALAHEAVAAASAKGKLWEMARLVLRNQTKLSKGDLLDYAASVGLDRTEMQAALDSGTYRAAVQKDLAEAAFREVRGSPVFFINDKRVDGIQPLALFREYVDGELRPSQGAAEGAKK